MRFWLLVWFVMWRLAFCGRQQNYFHGPYLRSVSLLYVIVSLFSLLAITEMFHCAGALRLDNYKVFGVLAARFHFVCFFINKYESDLESRSLKCFLTSCFHLRRRQLRLVCVGTCVFASSMMKIRKCLTLFSKPAKQCLVGLATEINKTVKTVKLSCSKIAISSRRNVLGNLQ